MGIKKAFLIFIILMIQISMYAEKNDDPFETNYKQFLEKIEEYKSILKNEGDYNQICIYISNIKSLHNKSSLIKENGAIQYYDKKSGKKLRIDIYGPNESLKGTYGLPVKTRVFYYQNETVIFSAYLLNDKQSDLLITVKNLNERKIVKYLILRDRNRIQKEVVPY